MIKLYEFLNKNENWKPLIVSLIIILLIAITHKIYWETTTETDPEKIWNGQTFSVNNPGENENQVWNIDFEQQVGDVIIFKGVLETSPRNEVYQNFTTGGFIDAEGVVYKEDLYGKTMLNVGGMRILVNGGLGGEFFESEIVTVRAHLVRNITTFQNGGQDTTLFSERWEAEPEDVKLASDVDYYFFGIETLIFIIGSYLSLKRIDKLNNQMSLVWHLAKFEFENGVKSSRMIVLGLFFSLFIIGIGWVLGDMQDTEVDSSFYVESGNHALLQFCFFTFFVVSLAAIAVSVDSFHKERQTNTMSMLLARPITREAIVVGKALGLTMVIGLPAFVAQVVGLYLMISKGDIPSLWGIMAFLLFGQIMIFTMISFQLCFAVMARNGTDVVIYGLGAWLLFAIVWNLLVYAISFAIGIELSEGFETNPEYQVLASHLGLFNPGYVYQFAVGLLTHRTIAIDMGGIPGWLVLLALVLWPLTCLRVSTWLFKREMKG